MTKVILLPKSMVAIKREGFLVTFCNTRDEIPSCNFSISKKIRLEETKAISIPEKNAERIKPKIMTKSVVIIENLWIDY